MTDGHAITQVAPASPQIATRATSDEQVLASWVDSLPSPATRRTFRATGELFLDAIARMGLGLRSLTVEDCRTACISLSVGRSEGTQRQYTNRVKSLLSYAHKLGYTRFNAGVAVVTPSAPADVARRIITETEVALLIRAASRTRDKVLLQVAYAGGLRVSEIVGLTWGDVIERDGGQVQLSVLGKGGKRRQVLLPAVVSGRLMALRGEAGPSAPLFVSRKGGRPLTARGVHDMIKGVAQRAGVNPAVSAHWLRHAHGSHALDRGATLAEVKDTLGHANVSTTSAYLHVRPDRSSGLKLDDGVFGRD